MHFVSSVAVRVTIFQGCCKGSTRVPSSCMQLGDAAKNLFIVGLCMVQGFIMESEVLHGLGSIL